MAEGCGVSQKHPRGAGKDRKRRRNKLYQEQDGLCHWCKKDMRDDVPEDHPDRVTLDHVMPISKGGTNDLSNLVAACFACNQERKNVPPEIPQDTVKVFLGEIMPEMWKKINQAQRSNA